MSNYLVITAVGQDRPGIVKSLTHTVTEHKCNIEDSRMSILGGEFAIILLISGNWNTIAKLETLLPRLGETLGLQISTKQTEARQTQPKMRSYLIEALSVDHPGIVHQVAEFFSNRSINIDGLSSNSYNAAHTGTPMFSLNLTINIPSEVAIAELREDFLDFCDDLNMDGIMEPIRN